MQPPNQLLAVFQNLLVNWFFQTHNAFIHGSGVVSGGYILRPAVKASLTYSVAERTTNSAHTSIAERLSLH